MNPCLSMRHRTPLPHDMLETRRRTERLQTSTLAWLLALLSACGGRTEPTRTETAVDPAPLVRAATGAASPASPATTRNATEPGSLTGSGPPTQRGVLLPGLAGENAYDTLQPYAAEVTQPTPLSATLDLAATVGQVNAALAAVGARIVAMRPGHKTLTIELTTPGEPATNQTVAARLIASHAFQWVQGPGLPVVPREMTADPAVSEPPENLSPRPGLTPRHHTFETATDLSTP